MTARVCLALLLSAAPAAAEGPPAPAPAPGPERPSEFKLVIQLFELRNAPLATADLVVRGGVAYQFLDEAPEEVLIIDPGRARVTLFDLRRKVQADVSSKALDANLGRLHRRLSLAVAAKAKSADRSARVAAAMTRDLIDPRLRETFDARAGTLRLSNPTVEVEAAGEPDPDPARVDLIANALAALAKIGALRDPDSVPPFARIAVIRALAVERHLRPTEVTVVYRLSGPPKKLRWTYRLTPGLTDREREALARIDRARATTPFVPYERYEPEDDD